MTDSHDDYFEFSFLKRLRTLVVLSPRHPVTFADLRRFLLRYVTYDLSVRDFDLVIFPYPLFAGADEEEGSIIAPFSYKRYHQTE